LLPSRATRKLNRHRPSYPFARHKPPKRGQCGTSVPRGSCHALQSSTTQPKTVCQQLVVHGKRGRGGGGKRAFHHFEQGEMETLLSSSSAALDSARSETPASCASWAATSTPWWPPCANPTWRQHRWARVTVRVGTHRITLDHQGAPRLCSPSSLSHLRAPRRNRVSNTVMIYDSITKRRIPHTHTHTHTRAPGGQAVGRVGEAPDADHLFSGSSSTTWRCPQHAPPLRRARIKRA
jgi:hypothetical protein